MNYLKSVYSKNSNLFKIVGVAFLVIIVLSFLANMLFPFFTNFSANNNFLTKEGAGSLGYDSYGLQEESYVNSDSDVGLSIRNVTTAPTPLAGYVSGNDAENFEVTDYNAFIETRILTSVCQSISSLKSRYDVIFENSNEYDSGCNYYFKAKKESVDEILAFVEDLHPRDLSENTYTIKKRIEDFTSQQEILERKQTTIEETLESAIFAYDEITEIARQSRNADALASIIDSKIRIIERLTNERINVAAQLDQLSRAKAEQLDRLEYTYFSVNVVENKFIDGQEIKDSWKWAVKDFVRKINIIFQDITVGLVSLVFIVFKYVIYLFILLLLAKYGWVTVKYIWKK